MKIDLTGKTAIVTGSTLGIGYAVAKGLAETGATVVVNGRSPAKVEAAVAALKPFGDVRGAAADLATAAGVEVLVKAVPAPDILVNNMGIFALGDFFETTDETWSEFFEVNVMSGIRLSRAYLPGMAERGWGRVVFLSSESALNIPADMIHYGVSKTANLAVSRGLAKRIAGTGVTVNAVLPGPTLTEGVAEFLKADVVQNGGTLEEAGVRFVKAHRPGSLIQRAASPEEVANMVVYACSQQASATTGAALRVDGGLVDTIG